MIDLNVRRTLLRAASYRDFGGNVRQGKVHLLKEHNASGERRTFCGKTLVNCPGKIVYGLFSEVDCKTCRSSAESAVRYAKMQSRWAEEAAIRQTERLEQSRQWWTAYDQYLQTPIWREKRRIVLRRARGLCEGCGPRLPDQVHHRNYPQGVLPGSAEWIRLEKLFDLVALCTECHEDIHSDRDDDLSQKQKAPES